MAWGEWCHPKIKFNEAMTATITSNHRVIAPYGLAGREAGKVGSNYIIRSDGKKEKISATAQIQLQVGDVFVIKTPGGGGFGAKR